MAEDIGAFGADSGPLAVVLLFLEYLSMAGCSLGSFGDGCSIRNFGDIGQYR